MHENGFVIECGADSFISEKPWALDLARRLGLEDQLVPTGEARRTMVVCRGKLIDVPAGFNLLAPVDLMPILKSPILSLRGKLRLVLEPMLPRRVANSDESIAAFVTRRMGREVLDRPLSASRQPCRASPNWNAITAVSSAVSRQSRRKSRRAVRAARAGVCF